MNQQKPATTNSISPSTETPTTTTISPVTTSTNNTKTESAINIKPTRVIHFRHVTSEISQFDIVNLCSTFGKVTHVLLLKNNQALVQFADLNCAIQFIQHYGGDQKNLNRQQATIRGVNVYPNYSSHKELSKGALEEKESVTSNNTLPNKAVGAIEKDAPPDETKHQEKQNRIILVTLYNVHQYTINADTIYQVFHRYGIIEKIVMFNKSGHQALVQYQRVQDAVRARQALQGQCLYNNNICSLSIQYSNLVELTVHQNSDRARDYTKTGGSLFSQGILSESGVSTVPQQQQQWVLGTPMVNGALTPTQPQLMTQNSIPPVVNTVTLPQPREPEKTVLLVSNFNDKKMSIMCLFNLFSCYGYVLRIKIFRSKPDHALVELANHHMASTALTNLKGLTVYGNKLSINFSKHTHINASSSTIQGSNGNSDDDLVKDFTRTNLNRFSKTSVFGQQGAILPQLVPNNSSKSKANQRYMCQPTTTLHISNVDVKVDEKELIKMFEDFGELEGHRVYEHNEKRMALIKFKKLSESAEALCSLHNKIMEGKSIKIAFSMNKL
jgi:hnRNP-L/PTB/hephaestus splicing factor